VFFSAADEEGSNKKEEDIQSPVLQSVWPDMLRHIHDHGHPNIPLGNAAGRNCQTLRRLRVQNKLVESDIKRLTAAGFTWHSLEDVYQQEKDRFEEFVDRLTEYAATHDGDLSPAKKYVKDPELGAWVTGLRRLGPDRVDPKHAATLNDLGFSWTSPRACGSAFMKQYRGVRDRLAKDESVWEDATVQRWVRAQQEAADRMTETRKHYMEQLLGPAWKQWKPDS
jgi:hypothetical protein